MRRNIAESEAFEAAAQYRETTSLWTNFALIFSPKVFPLTAMASLMAAGALGGNYTILTWLVTYLRETQGLTISMTTLYLSVNIFGSFCGYVGMAYLSDFLGRRKTFALSAAGATVTVLVYTQLQLPMWSLLFLGFPWGCFSPASCQEWAPVLPSCSRRRFAATLVAFPTTLVVALAL